MFCYSKTKTVALQLSVVMVLIGCMSTAVKAGDDVARAQSAKTSLVVISSKEAKTTKSEKPETISIVALHQCKKNKTFLHSFDGKVYELADTNGRGKDLGRMPEGGPLFFTVVMLKEKKNGGLVNIVGPWGNSDSGYNEEHKRLADKYREHIRRILASKQIH